MARTAALKQGTPRQGASRADPFTAPFALRATAAFADAPVLPDAEEVDFTSTLHKSPRKHAATSRRYLSAEDMLGNGPEHEYGTDSRFEAGDAPPRRKPR